MTGVFGKLDNQLRTTVRYKLLFLVLFPIVLVMPIALALAIYWGKSFGYDQLFIKVNTDLTVAADVFKRIQHDYLDQLVRLGESFEFRTYLFDADAYKVQQELDKVKRAGGYSFLHLIDRQRRWQYEDYEPQVDPRSLRSETVVKALAGKSSYGVEVFDREALEREGLAAQIRLPLLATARAVPTAQTVEERGMIIRVSHPVRDAAGIVIAVLDGGVLLNGNFEFVDAIRDLVYGAGSLPPDSIGTVTVFLDDIRISTNVPLAPGERALGTRVSRQVREQVLARGVPWIDRAFVVNDWYISGYEPIYDVRGKRIGMLYAGFLETPFRRQLWQAFWVLAGLFIALMIISALLAIRGAKTIFRPLEAMTRVVAATRRGEDKRIGSVASRDEIGELARGFDIMLDLLNERSREIRQAADLLEIKVEERTSELRERNAELNNTIQVLRKTRNALVEAEKLAALGELTAGVAHEINNPLAVILGNFDVIVKELDPYLDPVRAESELIVAQIYRIKDIVQRLLQYARPADYAGYVTDVAVNELLSDTLQLVQHLIKRTRISVQVDASASCLIRINPQELQQVLVNLLVNAIHAVDPNDGQIVIATWDWENRGVVIEISDNGPGIPAEALRKIFNPFYSTKDQGEGTGLGLSISYGLVRRYGGRISAKSELAGGSEFLVWLLREPEYRKDEETIAEQLADLPD